MNRLQALFQNKANSILNFYCTAGYPTLDATVPVMQALAVAGVDIIELGIPYSDPLADGPVIQQSSTVAISNGITTAKIFEQAKEFRSGNSKTPVVAMGYMNSILQYGAEKFCADAAAAGIDGLIFPDLPVTEFESYFKEILEKHGLCFSFLVTPKTSPQRVQQLDNLSSGFLYAVSSLSTTGADKNFEGMVEYLDRLQSYKLKNPVLVGFGIKDKQSFQLASAHAQGAIVGTAFIKVIAEQGASQKSITDFVQSFFDK